MMKRTFLFMLVLALVISVCCCAFAANQKVVDQVGLLNTSQALELSERAQALADTYQLDAAIVIVNTLGGKTAQAYADDYFDYNGYGVGEDDSGVLLLIAMNEREWHVSTHAQGIDAVTYDEIGYLEEDMVDYLSNGDYYDAFTVYLDFLETEFDYYRTFECGFTLEGFMIQLLIALVVGAVIAGIALLIMRSNMNTVRQQSGAASYMVSSSYDLYRCQDIFLYSRTTKTPKSQNNSSSSTHRSSSGRSHGGRGGKF